MSGVKPVLLRGVELGTGRPKICVPLVDSDVESLQRSVEALPEGVCELVELRIDHFGAADDHAAVRNAVRVVRRSLPDTVPVLFTFRSSSEGGQREIEVGAYEELCRVAVESGDVDAIDVEMFTELGALERIVNHAHSYGRPVVMSSHDFRRTPGHDQLTARLALQQDLGADILKLAVMPESPADVLTLLSATNDFVRTRANRPVITMAMGSLGVATRVAGEVFGSCMTFGSVGATSAPGQVDASELRRALNLVHGT